MLFEIYMNFSIVPELLKLLTVFLIIKQKGSS